MESLQIKAYGKINITLDVLGLRSDGYHEIEMILQSIDLFDLLSGRIDPSGSVKVKTNHPGIPGGDNNIVIQAARKLQEECGIAKGVIFELDKRIPVAAGLGGGSTDCAAALKILNRLWNLELSSARLMEIGAELGSDVPFCLQGGTAFARGRGEKLTPLPSLAGKKILLVNPSVAVSTAEVYRRFDFREHPPIFYSRRVLKEFREMPFARMFYNDLESVTSDMYPVVGRIIDEVFSLGGTGSMSGSGPTVIGYFEDEENLNRAFTYFSGKYSLTYRVHTI